MLKIVRSNWYYDPLCISANSVRPNSVLSYFQVLAIFTGKIVQIDYDENGWKFRYFPFLIHLYIFYLCTCYTASKLSEIYRNKDWFEWKTKKKMNNQVHRVLLFILHFFLPFLLHKTQNLIVRNLCMCLCASLHLRS